MTVYSHLQARLARAALPLLWASVVACASFVPGPALAQAGTAAVAGGAVRVDAVEVELVGDRAAIVPGEAMQLGLRIRHDPQWHTYWRNPGDSGLPTQVALALPEGFEAGAIEWPAPQRLFIPPLANYGYEDEIVLPMPLTVPAHVDGERVRFAGKASWLMCREICIPGEADVALELPVQRSGTAAKSRFAPLFDAAERRTPRETIDALVRADGDRLAIGLPGAVSTAEFFPYRTGLLRNAEEQVLSEADGEGVGAQLVVRLSEDGAREAQRDPAALLAAADGIVIVDGRARELSVRAAAQAWTSGAEISRVAGAPAAMPATASGRPALPGFGAAPGASRIDGSAIDGSRDDRARSGSAIVGSLWVAALFGAIGGLILNLMPCVFPVIGLKVLGFMRQNGEADSSSRINALVFAAGVVVSFWVLAGLLLALRSAGEAAGWGFQLQSPAFVAAMALLFVAIGLNFSGVYQIGTSLTRLGRFDTGERGRHPILGSFGSGVLAVLVATPCTAPFMGSALGYTLGSSTTDALVVFTAIALGMALPYLLLGFFPGWLRWLPRPGRWMETFRQSLAFPMYATAAWLGWVLGQQAGIDAVFALAIGAVLIGFAAWLLGRFVQDGASASTRGTHARRRFSAALAAAAFATALLAVWPATQRGDAQLRASTAGATPGAALSAGTAQWLDWSSERVREARAARRPVFVDFTAAWCVSCQANKLLVLERESIVSEMAQRGVVRLRADWTHRDDAITAELARFGRNGVPLYLLYGPGDDEPQILPELLTTGIVRDALSRIARAPSPPPSPPASPTGL